jgi:nitroreductase
MRPTSALRPPASDRSAGPAASDAPPSAARGADDAAWSAVRALIHERQNVAPKRLEAPGPDAAQLDELLHAAAAAPDHGRLTPWRFVLVPADRRARLAEVFAAALLERDPVAGETELAQAREKAFRGPLLMLAVARLGAAEPDIPALERVVSLGCAIQNLLLAAQALGYGCGLASGQAMGSTALRTLFRLVPGEEAVCFVSVGTVREPRPPRPRPQPADILSSL